MLYFGTNLFSLVYTRDRSFGAVHLIRKAQALMELMELAAGWPVGFSAPAAIKSSKLRFNLNGQPVEIDNPNPRQLLVHWLRESGHTGTKVY